MNVKKKQKDLCKTAFVAVPVTHTVTPFTQTQRLTLTAKETEKAARKLSPNDR